MTCHQLLSPLLRRLCVSSSSSKSPRGSLQELPDIYRHDQRRPQDNIELRQITPDNPVDPGLYAIREDVDCFSAKNNVNKTGENTTFVSSEDDQGKGRPSEGGVGKHNLQPSAPDIKVSFREKESHVLQDNTTIISSPPSPLPAADAVENSEAAAGKNKIKQKIVRCSSNQESLTKDEARKRMLSWRKTTKPRTSFQPGKPRGKHKAV
jgi:hypothetical protein